MVNKWFKKSKAIIFTPLIMVLLALLLAVACGTAAPEADTATSTPTKAAATPTLVPTVVPEAMAEPTVGMADVKVHPGKVIIMVGGWGGRFTLLHATNCHNYDVNFHGYNIRSDDNREFIPGIATAWDISPDGKTWTVTVRDDATFHDGKPVTAEDVFFTWQGSWGPEGSTIATSGSIASFSKIVEKVEQFGTNQVSITTTQVDAGFPGFISDTSGACQGMVLPEHFWGPDKWYDEELISEYDVNPIGAGPLKLIEHLPDELMAFERFDDYYAEDKRLKVSFVDLRKVSEEATRAAALRAGDADIAPVSLATSEQVEAGGGRIVWGEEASYMWFRIMGGWIPESPLRHKEVRQALAHSLDMREFQALFGEGVFVPKGWSHVTPSSIGYTPDIDPFPYDPDKARELLAQAGFPKGEGFGTFVIHTWISRAVPFLPESAQLAADQWERELGIDVEVRTGDETALKKASRGEDLYGQALWRDNEARKDGGSIIRGQYGTPDYSARAHNDPEIYKLAAEAMAVVKPAEREEAFRKIYKRLRDDAYRPGIGYWNVPWGVGPKVSEWQPQPMAFYPSNLHTIVLAE